MALFFAASCASVPGSAPEPDRSVATLDRLLRQGTPMPKTAREARRCIAALDAKGLCPEMGNAPKDFDIRLALDPRYAEQWPNWSDRLHGTFDCVNQLFAPTGIRWRVVHTRQWDPGPDRHQLYALLHRLRNENPSSLKALAVGIIVWDEQRVYRMAGGEIGLSQGGTCVVPSWPRVENDCVILAHELGHLTGAKHVAGKQWIMGWAAQPFYLPADDPLARVVSRYRFHPRNRAAIAAHRSAHFSAAGLLPHGDCRERIRQLDACWQE